MDTSHIQDEELGASEVLWSPDLDARWRLLRRHITPFEKDRMAYHSAKYQKPVFVYMNPVIWRRLVEKQGAYRAVDLMLMLGFAPAPEGTTNLVEWIEREAAVATRGTAGMSTATTASSASSPVSSGGGLLPGRRSLALPTVVSEEPRTNGGVRFWVLNHEDSRPSSFGSPVNQYISPRSTASGAGASSSANGPTVAPVSLPAVASAPAQATAVVGPQTEAEATASRIRNLEAEVKELTRQIRLLKSRDSDRDGSVLSDVTSQNETPQPHIIVSPDRPFIASTNCHALVCLPVNYLDPDCAPYVVSLGVSKGRTLLACSIVEHRYVIFLAPPHRRGSMAVVLLCTRDGTLRPYTRAVWLEYRAEDPPNTLTHHAVNQLLQEIPLPSSATVIDPNPSEVEQTKSESAFEDDNTFCDTDTAVSTSDQGLDSEPRLPLTKEMLQLIPNGIITGPRVSHAAKSGQANTNGTNLSVVGSESSLCGGDREGRVRAGRLWNDNDELKPGSVSISTGQPTSYQRGPQSGFSDEETTQVAFNCMTNRTEMSSSRATSVISLESAIPNGGGGFASIMASRGWVRRYLQGSPRSSQCFGTNGNAASLSATATVLDEQLQCAESQPSWPRGGSVTSQ
ncbi:hypothetical protein MOQ_000267 [Trypanosoma cruzi marinkellei]|uniref:Uncharacterized protein n=1 Tax=Trypanosoma cruzi marinkellei TaxID=85056 RepID=K2NJD5_TRYCR|nr:hypothetical protein MOQ_000267 [Trypanosoma cruzi marinkellei]